MPSNEKCGTLEASRHHATLFKQQWTSSNPLPFVALSKNFPPCQEMKNKLGFLISFIYNKIEF